MSPLARKVLQAAHRDELQKLSFVGPLVDVSNLGIPSAVGYHMGANKTHYEEDDDEHSFDPLLGLMLPGYIGYHFGVKAGARADQKRKHAKAKKK